MKRQIFIAAGGKGKRLGAITAHTPKSLVNIGGAPIIDHIIAAAEQARIDQIVVGLDDDKEALRQHLAPLPVEIEEGCVEPLTDVCFRSVARRKPDAIIGVNGDTLYRPQTIERVTQALDAHPDAAAVVLLTKVTRPVLTASYYWRHTFDKGILVAMEEVPNQEISTEFVMAIFRRSALEKLSEGYSKNFTNASALPFKCYSWGWDYLLRLLLWKQFKIVGIVSDDLSLNINHPIDLEEGEYFFTDPGLFRWCRLTPIGCQEPPVHERTLVLLKPQAFHAHVAERLTSELAHFGLKVLEERWHSFDTQTAREWYGTQRNQPWFEEAAKLLSSGQSQSLLVEGKGAFYRGLCWEKHMREAFAIPPPNNFVHATYSPHSFEMEFQRELSILNALSRALVRR